jgi:hypothetical protein
MVAKKDMMPKPRATRRPGAKPVPLAPAPKRVYPKGTPVPMPNKEGNYGKPRVKARPMPMGPKKSGNSMPMAPKRVKKNPARRKMI